MGARPYPAHASRVNDAKEIQDSAVFMGVTFDEARKIWEEARNVYVVPRSERK